MRRLFVVVPFAGAMACGSGDGSHAVAPIVVDASIADAAFVAPDDDAALRSFTSALIEEDVGEPPPPRDPDTGPSGWCLSRGSPWKCAPGGTCTFTGHCTIPDAGASSAGSVKCGLVSCDLAWCVCFKPSESTCDCS